MGALSVAARAPAADRAVADEEALPMANFPTHIAVGTVVSGALAVVTLAADVVAPENIVAVTLAGVVGSVLPDIDLKESRPSRAMFAGLAVFFSFVVLFSLGNKYSIAEMLVLWLGTLVLVGYVGRSLFFHFSYHRGIWHSLLAAVFCGCLTAVIYSKLLGRNEGVAWLDEIYSVDIMDAHIKASFGTAIKLFDYRHLVDSSVMAVAAVLAFLAAPPTKVFFEGMSSHSLWTELRQRMLPHEGWFGVDWRHLAAMPRGTSGSTAETTGSIAPASDAAPKP
jgi:LexA-binding, inner membrane-associated putative hydrolase